LNKKHLKEKIIEISAYTTLYEVKEMYVTIGMSMLEDDKKRILYKALDIQEKFLEGKYEVSTMVVTSELRMGET